MKFKKYLIIGGHGFIGSHLVRHILLNDKDADIHVYDIDVPTGNPSDKIKKARRAETPSSPSIGRLLNIKFDYVFHLGSIAGVRSDINSATYYENNNGALQMHLEKLKHNKFIYISSSSVLGDIDSSYSVSKKIAEAQVQYYKPNSLIIRPFTVYGPLGRPDMLVTKILNKEILTINGDPRKRFRYFTYVGDLLKCIWENKDEVGIINAIGHKQYSIFDVLEISKAKFRVKVKDKRDFNTYDVRNGKNWICSTKLEDYLANPNKIDKENRLWS